MSRKVIFIRGPQGTGKSTLMRRAGLEGFNLSLDKIRNVLAGDMMNPNGQFTPSHENESLAFNLFRESRDRRIDRGEVVCIDGTLADGSMLQEHWKAFEEAGYKELIVDLYGFEPELAKTRNAARVERMREIAREEPIPAAMIENVNLGYMEVRNDEEAKDALGKMRFFLRDQRCALNLSGYDRVVHISDLQGCLDPLMAEGSPVKSHYYRNWKRMRGAVVHIRKVTLEGREANLERYEDVPEQFREFLSWARTLPAAALENDIVALRASFEGDRSIMENVIDTHAIEIAERKEAEQADRFAELIDSIAANEKISEDGVARFVQSALEDPVKAEVLRAQYRGAELIERAGLEEVSPGMDL